MEVVEANGARIPAIGLGTMTLQDAVCVEAVKAALRFQFRIAAVFEQAAIALGAAYRGKGG